MAFRSHCNPKTTSNPPTTSRKTVNGIKVNAGPRTATTTASTMIPETTPLIAERQSQPVPAASTMVNASTASTTQARNTARNSAPLLITPNSRQSQ